MTGVFPLADAAIAASAQSAYDCAAEYNQHLDNVKHMTWFRIALEDRLHMHSDCDNRGGACPDCRELAWRKR